VSILPVWEVVLAMIIKHIPNPRDAQSYRIKKIWTGDLTSKIGKDMTQCNPKGPLIMCMSNIKYDSHGLIATGRIFSGTLQKGEKVYLVDANESERVQKVAIYMGSRLDNVESIPAGNIAAISGLKSVKSGETIVDEKVGDSMTSFENVKYVSEPVVTVSVEPEKLKDLDILHEYLDQAIIEDPNLKYYISNETGEILLSGLGPLHLEVVCKDIEKKGLNVVMSRPMAVFRESIIKASKPMTFKNIDNISEITIKIERNDLKTVQYLNTIKLSAYSSFSSIIKSIIEHTSLSKEEAEGFMFLDEFGNFVTNKVENLEIEKYRGKKIEYQRKKIEEKR
jgi:elongation factor 2